MEARSVDQIPAGEFWQYEPKWDGFHCIAFRDGEKVYLQSKAGQESESGSVYEGLLAAF